MKYEIPLQGVCPMSVSFDLEGDIVTNISFLGGCNGNLKAISTLVDGWTVDQITEKLAGNTCGFKQTSCADQLTIALAKAMEQAKA